MIRIFKRLPGVIFMVLLLGLAGKEALSHQRTYSPVEKRELQTRPEISITKVLDGRFQKNMNRICGISFPEGSLGFVPDRHGIVYGQK